jgi:hypothetical protein
MSGRDAKLSQTSRRLEDSVGEIKEFNLVLRAYRDRIADIAETHKKKRPCDDSGFAEDFRETALKLRRFTDEQDDFWTQYRAFLRENDSRVVTDENKLLIKRMISLALDFTRQAAELSRIFKDIRALGKDFPARLNWVVVESCNADLDKIAGKILFLIRNLERQI